MELQVELLSSLDERLAETEDIVANVLAGAESILQPPVASRIVALIIAGLRINEAVAALDPALVGDELRTAIAGYGSLAKEVLEEIQDITVDGTGEVAEAAQKGPTA